MTDLTRPNVRPSNGTGDSPAAATSRDGTSIAYARRGDGPALVLVDGALGSRDFGPNGGLVSLLCEHFTVYHYDRRGRGASGDDPAYAAAREVEDLEAIIDVAGGEAYVYGVSSGGVLALETARARPGKIRKLAIYEPPFVVDDTRAPWPHDYQAQLRELMARGHRGQAVALFMRRCAGIPAPLVWLSRIMPVWSTMTSVAPTLIYDAEVMGATGGGAPLPPERFTMGVPTLVVSGAKSPAWLRNASDAVAALLPDARRRTLPGQTHYVKPKAIAPSLADFFTDRLDTAR